MKKTITIVVILGILFVVILTIPHAKAPEPTASVSSRVSVSAKPTASISPSVKLVLLSDVPFTSQAPFGGWDDPRQQDGCEETSSLMAVYWAQHKTLTPDQALAEILAAADYEQATYGSYHDTDAQDTVTRIIKGYFKYTNATARSNINVEDIKKELYAGHIVLTPMNGQKLGNPNFTGGGPERHMLVIIGYDPAKNQFITNDPGTRKGKGYRYSAAVIQGALREYPTGDHLPITDESRTAMIVVSR